MKLINPQNGMTVELPNDLLWQDEMKWTPTTAKRTYTLTGSLIYEVSKKQAGRMITLVGPDSMAWVTRTVVDQLQQMTNSGDTKLTLQFEYPEDTRTFIVLFRHDEGAIEAEPVKGFPTNDSTELFKLTIKLLEAPNG